MKRYFYTSAFWLLSVFFFTCKNPADDVNLVVAQPFTYLPVIQVTDAKAQLDDKESVLPADLSVAISGKDAEFIYTREGYRDFKPQMGLVGLGISPKRIPTEADPVRFNVSVTGASILPKTVSVTIGSADSSRIIPVSVVRLASAPLGMAVDQPAISLKTDGSTANEVSVGTTAKNGMAETTEITIPAATQFLNADGAVVVGSQVKTILVQADPSKESSLLVFPGGSLISENVQFAGGETGSATLSPAGYVDITMSVNGTDIKRFSKPLQVSMQIDPSFYNPNTGGTVKAGDVLDIYSYEVTTNKWTFEQSAGVASEGGKLQVSFPVSHLTGYAATVAKKNYCIVDLTFTLPVYPAAFYFTIKTYSVKADGSTPDKLLVTQNDMRRSVGSMSTRVYPNGINGNDQDTYLVVFTTSTGYEMGRAYRRGCQTQTPIELTLPPIGTPVTMQLFVSCPNKGSLPLSLLPAFELFYRPAGSAAAYKLLGQATMGYLFTTELTTGTAYDFRAHGMGEVKYVYNKVITGYNNTTVGTGQGETLGGDAENNLKLLTEKCREVGWQ